MFKLEDLLKKRYDERNEEYVTKIDRYHFDRLRRSCYEIRDESEHAIRSVVRVFSEIESHKRPPRSSPNQPPPSRGVMLYGPCGTGKSTLLKRLSAWEDVVTKSGATRRMGGVEYISTMNIVQNYMVEGERWLRNYFGKFRRDFLVIDEIGSERNVKRFGSDSPVADVIEERYEAFQDFGTITIFATNMKDRNEVDSAYGTRVRSRLAEMCKFVLFRGSDWRQDR